MFYQLIHDWLGDECDFAELVGHLLQKAMLGVHSPKAAGGGRGPLNAGSITPHFGPKFQTAQNIVFAFASSTPLHRIPP